MDTKSWLRAAIGAFAVVVATDFLVHHMWLGDFYRTHAGWWRPEAEMSSMMPLMLLAQMAFAALLALVYTRGYERKKEGMAQGLRFGILMGLFVAIPHSLMTYVIYPYPEPLVWSWFMGCLLKTVLAGVAIGALYKPAKG